MPKHIFGKTIIETNFGRTMASQVAKPRQEVWSQLLFMPQHSTAIYSACLAVFSPFLNIFNQ